MKIKDEIRPIPKPKRNHDILPDEIIKAKQITNSFLMISFRKPPYTSTRHSYISFLWLNNHQIGTGRKCRFRLFLRFGFLSPGIRLSRLALYDHRNEHQPTFA